MSEILVISCTNMTQMQQMVMGEIGSDLWQFHDWLIFNCPQELSPVKVPEKEILLWKFNLRKHLQGVWEGKFYLDMISEKLISYDFWVLPLYQTMWRRLMEFHLEAPDSWPMSKFNTSPNIISEKKLYVCRHTMYW